MMFKFVGSLLGKIFGTEKSIEAVVASTTKALDALVYTEEERATDASQARSEARSMVVQWMAATKGQNLARRLIALSITSVWLFQYVVAQALAFVAVFLTDATKANDAAKIMREGATEMNGAVMLILAFYFAAPHMGDIAKAVTDKFAKKV